MAKLAATHDRRLWQLPQRDRAKAYSVRRATPRVVEVLEQGKRTLHRERVDPAAPGDYLLVGDWLVHRTYPRAAAAHAKRVEAAAAKATAKRRANAAARAQPDFKAYVAALTRELGKPRTARACDQTHLAFSAPDDTRCAELIELARKAGAAATLYYAPQDRELRVVAGGPAGLAGLFDWNAYGPGDLAKAIAALDTDAGLTLDFVQNEFYFALHLDRVPRNIAKVAPALAKVMTIKPAEVAKQLRKRRLSADD